MTNKIQQLMNRVARLEKLSTLNKPRDLEEALSPWIPGLKIEELESMTSFEVVSGKVDVEEDTEDTRFSYSYGSINGVEGREYVARSSSITGKFHLCIDPSIARLRLNHAMTRRVSNQALNHLKPFVDELIDEVFYDAISEALLETGEWHGEGYYAAMDITGAFLKRGALCLSLKGYIEATEPEILD